MLFTHPENDKGMTVTSEQVSEINVYLAFQGNPQEPISFINDDISTPARSLVVVANLKPPPRGGYLNTLQVLIVAVLLPLYPFQTVSLDPNDVNFGQVFKLAGIDSDQCTTLI
jgi:hypothetical protein